MYFSNQQAYEHYHSNAQRRIRTEQATTLAEAAVSEALALFNNGDKEAARQRLFDAGIQDEGVACYLQSWVQ